VLFGRSLGGGVAIDLASKHVDDGAVRAIVVENTFSSISSMVDCIFPYLSMAKTLLMRMKWNSQEKIATITRPILFISGAQVRCHLFSFPYARQLPCWSFLSIPPFLLAHSNLDDVFGSTYLMHSTPPFVSRRHDHSPPFPVRSLSTRFFNEATKLQRTAWGAESRGGARRAGYGA